MIIQYILNNWKYSNAPEGQRPFEKVIGLSKYGFGAGFGVGLYDCLLLSQTQTFQQACNCMAYWMVPFTAMCATFASVAYMVTKVRGRDGYANYIIASLATGAVFYHWQRKGLVAYHATVGLIACSMIKKHGDLIGWKPIDFNFTPYTQHDTLPFDFTLLKDPRGRRPWE